MPAGFCTKYFDIFRQCQELVHSFVVASSRISTYVQYMSGVLKPMISLSQVCGGFVFFVILSCALWSEHVSVTLWNHTNWSVHVVATFSASNPWFWIVLVPMASASATPAKRKPPSGGGSAKKTIRSEDLKVPVQALLARQVQLFDQWLLLSCSHRVEFGCHCCDRPSNFKVYLFLRLPDAVPCKGQQAERTHDHRQLLCASFGDWGMQDPVC